MGTAAWANDTGSTDAGTFAVFLKDDAETIISGSSAVNTGSNHAFTGTDSNVLDRLGRDDLGQWPDRIGLFPTRWPRMI